MGSNFREHPSPDHKPTQPRTTKDQAVRPGTDLASNSSLAQFFTACISSSFRRSPHEQSALDFLIERDQLEDCFANVMAMNNEYYLLKNTNSWFVPYQTDKKVSPSIMFLNIKILQMVPCLILNRQGGLKVEK